ncbi:imidazolonepropionase [Silvibacterium bohemicum]|uniref:Imidazolonepropionase n=1 Tax=Silvibacterium bohemicum TaxID=1577686 RepID=A0A841K247_9BACT|nr:imidazolonepropionase [Silvibacterium bohemicum]MBB6146009.1 imidazolonepropionase [Silvibacterium bohemicum]
MSQLLITNCSQLATLAGPARPRVSHELREVAAIADGAMLVRDGRIAAVGSRADIEPLAEKTRKSVLTINAGGRLVTPGFVDAHTHLVFAGNRADEFEMRCAGATYQEIAAQGGGIRSTVRKTRAASEEDLNAAATRYARWFLESGTTTVEAKSGYGLTVEDELKILRVIRQVGMTTALRTVPTFLGAHEIPSEYAGRADDYVGLIVDEMLPLVAREKLAEFCDIFCEAKVFNLDQARRVFTAANQHGLGLRMHADQFTAFGASELAAEMGAKTCDHLEQTSAASMEKLMQAGVQPVLLPGSVYAIGSQKYPAARAMIDAGLAVVLATDFNPGSSPVSSMRMVMSLACTQMKMTPAETLVAATVNAAYSLNRGHEIGSLETGKVADFVVHDAEDYRELPYFFGDSRAAMVFTNGISFSA